jgi:hypothetical protein
MVDGWLEFEIPNDPNLDLTKEVWVQYVFLSADSASVDITASGSSASMVELVSLEDLGGGGTSGTYHWWRRTELWEIDPQPASETITISTSGLSMIDQVAVDTRCVPEPATMGLLACGALGLIARRKRNG